MSNYNHTILVGNLTADPENRVTTSGKKMTTFTVAVNRLSSKERENREKEVLFMPCVAFDGLAEAAGKYIEKGDPVLVTGRLRENKWDQDGQTRSRIVLIAGVVQFLKSSGKTEEAPEEFPEAESEDLVF
jgi:single-strand DNA-binding protein